MRTTVQAAEEWVSHPSECQTQLLDTFGQGAVINVADIGACDGLSSVRYSKLFPRATFWAFEPLPGNVAQIRFFFERYGLDNHIYNYALSTKTGTAVLWESYGQANREHDWDTGNKSSSLLKPKEHVRAHPWCKFRKRVVKTCRLDDLLPGTVFDFAHIDVQGAELDVLKGGEKIFTSTRAFWIEVAKIELYAGQPLKRDIINHMERMGCRCILDTCHGNYGDMFFIR